MRGSAGSSTAARAGASAVAGGLAALAYATLVERRWYALRHVTVPVLRSPAARPLRLLHLSDLHLLPGQHDRTAFVQRCLASRPDVVVATGDFLGAPDVIDEVVELLGPAARARPCLAVLGSNDYSGPVFKNPLHYLTRPDERLEGERLDTDRLVAGLADAGWRMLDNRRMEVPTAGGAIDAAGLGDPHIGLDDPDAIDWSPPGDGITLRLGVVHAPYLRALGSFDHHGFDLVLAGHTHGGQLRVPFVGALTANCDLPLDRARGLSTAPRAGHQGGTVPPAGSGHRDLVWQHDPPWLHVSAGLGHSRYAPARFCCRPEATLLDLVGRRPAAPRQRPSD